MSNLNDSILVMPYRRTMFVNRFQNRERRMTMR